MDSGPAGPRRGQPDSCWAGRTLLAGAAMLQIPPEDYPAPPAEGTPVVRAQRPAHPDGQPALACLRLRD